MSETLQKVTERIEAEIKGHEYTAMWGCGKHLIDMLRADPQQAGIVLEDLDAGRTVAECEKQIKAYADQLHKKTKKNVFVPPQEAEKIIRKYFGLPERDEAEPKQVPEETPAADTAADDAFDLENFL